MRFDSAVAILLLGAAACGRADRCLDEGGRWNDPVGVCEFASGRLDTPGDAISAGKRTLEFAYGPAVLEQGPFLAELDGNVWHVFGTPAPGAPGGAAQAWIELESGHVRRVVRAAPQPGAGGKPAGGGAG